MRSLKGTHGTSNSRAESIVKTGFKLSSGRGGSGVYLWRSSQFSDYLAQAWYSYSYDHGEFAGDVNPMCAVIRAEIFIEDIQFLDLEDPDLKDKIIQLATEKKIDQKNKKHLSALYDLFISEIEKGIRNPILVVQLRVAPPPKEYIEKYPFTLAGAPITYIVRKTDIIKINEIV